MGIIYICDDISFMSGVNNKNIKMNKIALSLAFMLFALFTFAQNGYTAENKGWLVNLDEAYELSQKTGKPIMANFTGSDWCVWCKRLTAAVFVKDEFKNWADDNVILLELDFPRRKQLPQNIKQQNAGLQRALQVRGYPTVWVFNLEKDSATNRYNINALGKTGYKPSVKEFTSEVDQMLIKGKS